MQQPFWSEAAPGAAQNTLPEYGVGVDTELVARWRRLLPSLRARAQRRLFTEREHGYCERFADPAPVYAGHWCAKEAVFKALSSLSEALPSSRAALSGAPLTLDQIEIAHAASGCPLACLPGEWARLARVQLSISHDTERAMAFAVALCCNAGVEHLAGVLQQLAGERLG